jgi:hypothetical protein
MIVRGAANSPPLVNPVQAGGYLVICFLVGWLYAQNARKLRQRSDSLPALRSGAEIIFLRRGARDISSPRRARAPPQR